MKRLFFTALMSGGVLCSASGATTINVVNKFSYGANIGWMDWRGDTNNGAVIGEFVCSGFIYAANVGWINLGGGAPANGIRYQNNSATDFGVNHDGPKVDLLTGRLSGFAWSANCGWISLSNAQAFVQTDTIRVGIDTDGDGIPDAWELQFAGNLTTMNAGTDTDHDGFSDLQEYLADTNPFDPNSQLRITLYSASAGGSPANITWTSRPTRLYHIQKRNELNPGFAWGDIGLGLVSPDAGDTTTRMFTDSVSPQRFFRIEALKPLSP